MLHIVVKSHTQTSALQSCLRLAQDGQTLLLIEDAVYAASCAAVETSGLAEALPRLKIYALQPDVLARGINGKLAEGVTAIDYAGFVGLVAEHSTSQTWL